MHALLFNHIVLASNDLNLTELGVTAEFQKHLVLVSWIRVLVYFMQPVMISYSPTIVM
jgi:hypothetical protein